MVGGPPLPSPREGGGGGGGGGGNGPGGEEEEMGGKGKCRGLFMRQWPSLWTTTFGLMRSMVVIHNAGHW